MKPQGVNIMLFPYSNETARIFASCAARILRPASSSAKRSMIISRKIHVNMENSWVFKGLNVVQVGLPYLSIYLSNYLKTFIYFYLSIYLYLSISSYIFLYLPISIYIFISFYLPVYVLFKYY